MPVHAAIQVYRATHMLRTPPVRVERSTPRRLTFDAPIARCRLGWVYFAYG
jgi:hypothetical protein